MRLPYTTAHAFFLPPSITAKGARGLRNVEVLGLRQDPYLRLRAGGQVFQTRVHTDGGSMAQWNDRFQIQITTALERYVLVVLRCHAKTVCVGG